MVKNKIISSTLAAVLAISSAAPLAVEATSIPDVNSNFEYELAVEAVSKSRIKATFYTTFNPGVTEITLAVLYDSDKYQCVNVNPTVDMVIYGNFIGQSGINDEEGLCIYSGIFNGTTTQEDYTENFEISFYFEAKDGNATDESVSQFSAAVANYKSQNENVDISRMDSNGYYVPEVSPPEMEIQVTPEQIYVYDYILGDVNESGKIETSDATNIGTLVSVARAANVGNSVNKLNEMISENKTSTISSGNIVNWGERFNYFMRNAYDISFPCVESADANQDGFITSDDSQLVLDWYAQIAAGSASAEDILTIKHKTVYF